MQKNYLIALLLISGCASLKPFPAKHVYEVDLDYNVCGQYKIVNPETLQIEYVGDLPMSYCNGIFGFSADDMPKVLDWSEEAIKKVKQQN